MIPNVNREAIAQAAMAYIHVNNLFMEAIEREKQQEYIQAASDIRDHMQAEFLRCFGNATQIHQVSKLHGESSLAFAAVIYTSVTGLDIEVK